MKVLFYRRTCLISGCMPPCFGVQRVKSRPLANNKRSKSVFNCQNEEKFEPGKEAVRSGRQIVLANECSNANIDFPIDKVSCLCWTAAFPCMALLITCAAFLTSYFWEFGIEEPPYSTINLRSKLQASSLLGDGTSGLSINISITQMIPSNNHQESVSQSPEVTHNFHNVPRVGASSHFYESRCEFFFPYFESMLLHVFAQTKVITSILLFLLKST